MDIADIVTQLRDYTRRQPADADTARFHQLLSDTRSPLSRAQFAPGHITVSACVLSPDADSVLLLHHARLDRWLQPGGHVEPEDASPVAGARREVREESGIGGMSMIRPGGLEMPVDIDVHEIPSRRDEPAHLHYDLRYAFRSVHAGPPAVSEESHQVLWVPVPELARFTTEWSVTRLVRRALAAARQ